MQKVKNTTIDPEDLNSLKITWRQLDPELQVCAKQPFRFGKYDFTITLNEVGMAQLIEHLGRHGFEIKKKETS